MSLIYHCLIQCAHSPLSFQILHFLSTMDAICTYWKSWIPIPPPSLGATILDQSTSLWVPTQISMLLCIIWMCDVEKNYFAIDNQTYHGISIAIIGSAPVGYTYSIYPKYAVDPLWEHYSPGEWLTFPLVAFLGTSSEVNRVEILVFLQEMHHHEHVSKILCNSYSCLSEGPRRLRILARLHEVLGTISPMLGRRKRPCSQIQASTRQQLPH